MAEILLQGTALIHDIDAAAPPRGRACFWWLGQHSFVLKLAGKVVYIDPYLSPSPARQTPPLLTPEEIVHADLVLCTHDHGDHIDPFAIRGIAAASPHARFVAPRPHRQRLQECGVDESRLTLLSDRETTELEGITITAVKAQHEFFEEGPEGFPYLGYVLEAEGLAAYHAGDTLAYDGLRATLSRWALDAAFLPINGRDAVRYRSGCIGNMTFQEAVDLAGDLQVRLAVPAHWDMFAGNSEDPAKFVDYLAAKFPKVQAWLGKAGERVEFGG
jgi:L-ascorbate metabolism protein UlaG (beta-lactamase superfamily)